MSDLTDEELKCWMREDLAPPLHELLLELQRHRSAQAAREERVREVIREALHRGEMASNLERLDGALDAIATSAAKQLAGATIRFTETARLSAAERSQLEHHIRDHEATCSYSCSIIRRLLGAT